MKKAALTVIAILLLIFSGLGIIGFSGTRDGSYQFEASGQVLPVLRDEAPDVDQQDLLILTFRQGSDYYTLYGRLDRSGNTNTITVILVNLEDFSEESTTITETYNYEVSLLRGFFVEDYIVIAYYHSDGYLKFTLLNVPDLEVQGSYSLALNNPTWEDFYTFEDVNSDGHIDLIVEVAYDNYAGQLDQRTVKIYCVDSVNLATVWVRQYSTNTVSYDTLKSKVLVGNFDSDSKQELAVILNKVDPNTLALSFDVHFLDTNGVESGITTISSRLATFYVQVADYDRDSVSDIVGGTMWIDQSYQQHYGVFELEPGSTPVSFDISGLASPVYFPSSALTSDGKILGQDINGDGYNEIPALGSSGQNSFLYMVDFAHFNLYYTVTYPGNTFLMSGITAKDYDGDGLLDLFVYDLSNNILHLVKFANGQDYWTLDVDQQFPQYRVSYQTIYLWTVSFTAVDYNDDGYPEFLLEKSSKSGNSYTIDMQVISGSDGTTSLKHFQYSFESELSNGNPTYLQTGFILPDLFGQGGGDVYLIFGENSGADYRYYGAFFTWESNDPYSTFVVRYQGSELNIMMFPLVYYNGEITWFGELLDTGKGFYIYVPSGIPEFPF